MLVQRRDRGGGGVVERAGGEGGTYGGEGLGGSACGRPWFAWPRMVTTMALLPCTDFISNVDWPQDGRHPISSLGPFFLLSFFFFPAWLHRDAAGRTAATHTLRDGAS